MQARDLITQAIAKVGIDPLSTVSDDHYTLAEAFLNRVHEDMWRAYPLRDEKIFNLSVTGTLAGAGEMMFPEEVEAVRTLRAAEDVISPITEFELDRFSPTAYDESATVPVHYWQLADSPVLVQPLAASVITIVSSSSADTSGVGSVRVFGVVAGVQGYEDIVLNADTPASGSVSFTTLLSISKPVTTGRVTISDDDPVNLASIPPWQTASAYRRVRLYPKPSADVTLYAQCLRRCPRITSDFDAILLSRCETALFNYLCAELYDYDENPGMAAAARGIGGEQFQMAIAREVLDSEDTVSVPDFGMFGDDEEMDQPSPTHNTW